MASAAEIRDFLWPQDAETDEGFRAEVDRVARRGLRVIAWIEIVMPLLGLSVLVIELMDRLAGRYLARAA